MLSLTKEHAIFSAHHVHVGWSAVRRRVLGLMTAAGNYCLGLYPNHQNCADDDWDNRQQGDHFVHNRSSSAWAKTIVNP